MKQLLFVVLIISTLSAGAQVTTPQPSPAASTSTIVGLTTVKVEYSRPKAKGRKIFGAGNEFVVPFGNVWRTGANAGTIVNFSDDVKFGNTSVAKGSYLLLTIPGAAEWTVILSKDIEIGGDMSRYDQSKDAARVTVKADRLTEKVETFTVEIADLSENGKNANLQIMWENTSVKAPFTVDFESKVMASIEASTKLNPNNLFQAAVYYLENGKDLNKALEWATAACAARPDAFWMTYQKARIQKALGDKKGAMESANASRAVAEKAKNNDYVKMNDELLKSLK